MNVTMYVSQERRDIEIDSKIERKYLMHYIQRGKRGAAPQNGGE